jgi:hypothetical protein
LAASSAVELAVEGPVAIAPVTARTVAIVAVFLHQSLELRIQGHLLLFCEWLFHHCLSWLSVHTAVDVVLRCVCHFSLGAVATAAAILE